MERFLAGDDKYRNQRFKFIPRVVEGSWVVRRGGESFCVVPNTLCRISNSWVFCRVSNAVEDSRFGIVVDHIPSVGLFSSFPHFCPSLFLSLWRSPVGTTPAILGNKLRQTSYRVCTEQLNYLEVNVDVGSSSLGSNIFRLVKGYCRQLVMDLCFLVEAQADDELPEVLLGGVRMANVILSQTQPHPALQG